jgi:WD40 repeat protein/beta-lactamase regulating signal transducer with metallopeptidase domain
VALVQVTLVALLGLLAWLVVRRGGPALRGAVLLAALVGLVAVPGLAAVAPVWLPLPDCVYPSDPNTVRTDAGVGLPAPAADPTVYALLVTQPPTKTPTGPGNPTGLTGETTRTLTETDAVLLNLSLPPEETAPIVRPGEPSRPSWPLGSVLMAVWLLGALACLTHALVRLGLLYSWAWRARAVRDEDRAAWMVTPAECPGLPAVSLRESPAVTSPLTLGLFRPVILLPPSWRDWSAGQRALILKHELAHIRRRDFHAGLAADLAACLCWFHPLVRWLAGRLRLEQEYAADAAVAAAADSTEYVRCLARLALAQGRGRGSLAPAFWRRRPEILRRIDMLRRNPKGLPSRLGKRVAWTVAILAAVACLVVAGIGPLQSADTPGTAAAGPEPRSPATGDLHGDPLPEGALARLGTTRWRHGAEVSFVSFGPDGKTLVTAGRDDTIRLWDLASGQEIRRFARPRPAEPKPAAKEAKAGANVQAEVVFQMMAGGQDDTGTFSVALAPGGKILAASGGGSVQLWEVETGKELRRIEVSAGGLAGLLFSPDGQTLAGRAGNGTLYAWATDTGKEIRRIEPPPRPRGNGFVIVLGGGGGNSIAPGMAFTPDSKTLAAAATDRKGEQTLHSVKFWELASGKELRRINVPGDAAVSAIAIAPGGKVLAYGSGATIHLCEVDTGKELRQFKTPNERIRALVFAPDGKTLAVRGRNHRVHIWETDTGKEVRHLGDAEPVPQGSGLIFLPGASGPETRALAISPDGTQIATAAGSTVRVWETATGKELPLSEGHRQAPSAITLVTDGKTAVSWGADQVVRRWEAATGKSLGAFPAPSGTTVATFSAAGRTAALANADNTIRLHDLATGKELRRLPAHEGGTAALAFTAEGKVLAARGLGDNIIRLYDVALGTELRRMALRTGNNGAGNGYLILGGSPRVFRGTGPGLAFAPGGRLLVVTAPGNDALSNTLVLFDVATGKELRRIESPQPVASFAFSPDGRVLAAENADRTITCWEVASGKERGRLGKPVADQPQSGGGGMIALRVRIDGMNGNSFNELAGPVGLTYSPDGRALAARGSGMAVRVWDVASGKEVGQLKGHGGRVETVAFAPDGKTLASGSKDTTVLLWNAADVMTSVSKPQAAELPAAETETLWRALAGEDAAKALRGVRQLAGDPRQAVSFLGARLKPAARVDPQKVAGWIADLDSEKFAVRQQASANLLKVGEQAVPALQKVLASSPALETRKRVEELLDKLTNGTLTSEQLRLVRAVETLERIGTPEAQRLLRTLAEGAPGTLPTREAEAALERLAANRP